MKIALGLPVSRPESLLDWARRADAGPFSALGLLDRVVYDNPEPMVTLAAVAAATTRVRVQTEVLLSPLRNPTLLAKQSATLDRLSNGRFTLGLGIGARMDDFAAVGVDPRDRGRRLDEQMSLMRRIWAGEPSAEDAGPVGPAPVRPGGPEVLFGAFQPAGLARVARWGDGFVCAAPASGAGDLFRTVERFWNEADREGRPRLVAQVNVALGPESTVDEAREALRAYYAFTGDDALYGADETVRRMLTTTRDLRDTIKAYGDLGADEIMLYCWSSSVDQVDRLAELA
ncbi:LLM class flavin-dependent oxidoreductase [Streptomyces sp. NPDC058464]|uniref:LLM class flavin-dependent oxidoreductase n=1 Tax=Streptomyces sp. NPDC058464 TaxID=3346511 RepID=UPI00364E33B8